MVSFPYSKHRNHDIDVENKLTASSINSVHFYLEDNLLSFVSCERFKI